MKRMVYLCLVGLVYLALGWNPVRPAEPAPQTAQPEKTSSPVQETAGSSDTILPQSSSAPEYFPLAQVPLPRPPAKPTPPPPPRPEDLVAVAQPPAAPRTRGIYAPNMIGDAAGGACGSVQFQGFLIANLEFPNFSCLRLSVAEDNSPLPQDRVYFQYNHFQNITHTNVLGVTATLPIEKYTFGLEKTFLDGATSVEVRLPFSRQLRSNVTLQDIQGVTNLPVNETDTELGNVAVIWKLLLRETDCFALSTGLGINTPTGRDTHVHTSIHDTNFPPVSLRGGLPFPGLPVDLDYFGSFTNDTVNLSPFLSALWTPTPRFFAQGFLQFDVPVNSSQVALEGMVSGVPIPRVSTPIDEQTLMRADLGAGYWLLWRPCARWITGMAPSVEVHYTTTLNNAEITSGTFPLTFTPPTFFVSKSGNLANRVDVVDLTLGNTILIGDRTTLATGFVIPLSRGDNKPFDFEFALQLNWRFGYLARN